MSWWKRWRSWEDQARKGRHRNHDRYIRDERHYYQALNYLHYKPESDVPFEASDAPDCLGEEAAK